MRTPATVGAAGSPVGGFGVTRRVVAEPDRAGVGRAPLAVAFVALTTLDFGLGFFPPVNRERLADIIGLLELASSAAPYESLVTPSVDQFSPRRLFLPAAFFTVVLFVIPVLLPSTVQFGCPSMS
jgi:hypothetical protein